MRHERIFADDHFFRQVVGYANREIVLSGFEIAGRDRSEDGHLRRCDGQVRRWLDNLLHFLIIPRERDLERR